MAVIEFNNRNRTTVEESKKSIEDEIKRVSVAGETFLTVNEFIRKDTNGDNVYRETDINLSTIFKYYDEI